jgi:hypothetical protein
MTSVYTLLFTRFMGFDFDEPRSHRGTEALDAVGLPCRPSSQARERRTNDIADPGRSFTACTPVVAATRRRVERSAYSAFPSVTP